jgi:hypothetical protein
MVLGIAGAIARGQESKPSGAIPDTPPGRCAAAFLAMLNDGSEPSVQAFESAWASPKRVSRATIAERVAGIGRIRADMGVVRAKEVLAAQDDGIMLLVECATGPESTFEFVFDPEAPAKLEVVRISAGALRPQPLTPERRASTIEAAARCLEENYVFPEVGAKMAADVRARLASGGYDQVRTELALERRLVDDLRAISRDLHLRLWLDPESDQPASRPRQRHDDGRSENFTFRRVEILEGNVGYVRFDAFLDGEAAERTAAAALGFLAHANAIVFDLRFNGGGSPSMIRFITSWLFAKRTHLNDMVDRDGTVVEEYWTLDDIPGEPFEMTVPVYVLTSNRTFSGAEEFAYNLKALKRATIIGERTGGGAHPTRTQRINDRFVMGVPFMRACNPWTKTNWEGTGVEPDIGVPADAALDRALVEARAVLARRASPR